MYLYPGAYKNFDDLEASLTREELIKLYEKAFEIRKDDKRFAAALKGVDIDEGSTNEFDAIKRRAEAKARGISEEKLALQGVINIIDEDEES